MTPEAAWAELIRAEHLTDEPALDQIQMPIWACRVPAAGLIDLTDAGQRVSVGITEAALTADSWTECQVLGRELQGQNWRGVLAPCAALERHLNVTIFGARRQIDWRERPALARAVPAAIVAIGRPPRGLV